MIEYPLRNHRTLLCSQALLQSWNRLGNHWNHSVHYENEKTTLIHTRLKRLAVRFGSLVGETRHDHGKIVVSQVLVVQTHQRLIRVLRRPHVHVHHPVVRGGRVVNGDVAKSVEGVLG